MRSEQEIDTGILSINFDADLLVTCCIEFYNSQTRNVFCMV